MTKSNLLVIMSDEHQARAMGCAGHPFVQTPNLDALAARGTRFTSAYTPSPICVPARASFATGLYPHQTRLWDNAMPYDGSIRGWGHALQEKGIPVESIGKLHYRAEGDPAGFDIEHIPMMVAGGVGMVWASIRKEDERILGPKRMLGDYIGPGDSKYTEYDAAVVKRTKDWIADHAADNQPWCLYVGLVAPHFPLIVPQEFFDLYPPHMLPPAKLHPDNGHPRHPWIEKQNAFMDSEAKFTDENERLAAMSAYYGLCTWLDHNVRQILDALDRAGLTDTTTVVYTSDHGDNVGARGLWGKSNMYEESAAVPIIMAGPDVPVGVCDSPVSLLDLSATIAKHFDAEIDTADGVTDLAVLIKRPTDKERVVFAEYHAAGAVSGAFMLRKGNWKLIRYVGFPDELFDLENDPEELKNRASDPSCVAILEDLHTELLKICDPEQTDAQAFKDQAALIERHGGRKAALALGAPGATPPPAVAQ
ncbi:sulfatase-like hydrolase/transferase [Sulfitobacter sp. JBTF-M27]|uniref:Sulfatase-like hydrolase/transferase n=1 Tax=Sulfitobacter sediminilitoris TaxID=2698830 RepID=A0A6P0CJC2_9RHOB|nr:sulfatase-like hydrolase/transferase [Sulfitobacter sediminilitoris]NEK24613.1 sulfatase-like hydrolase/transferase [Sulfitobacter sediminilitoris]